MNASKAFESVIRICGCIPTRSGEPAGAFASAGYFSWFVGAIVVWHHHVGKIVGLKNGQWIVQSGNDGSAVRARPRSLGRAIAFKNAYGAF